MTTTVKDIRTTMAQYVLLLMEFVNIDDLTPEHHATTDTPLLHCVLCKYLSNETHKIYFLSIFNKTSYSSTFRLVPSPYTPFTRNMRLQTRQGCTFIRSYYPTAQYLYDLMFMDVMY